jgi:ubiquinone/menaquinone biosynthesis C-methylase UbiE
MSDAPEYLHGHHDSVLRSHRWRTAENSAAYFLRVIKPDWVLLDVGCGPGSITADFAELVPDGLVIGLDQSASVLVEASATSPKTPFVAADLFQLPFEPGSADAVHLHMVLQHVPDPVGALRAVARLVRPGGYIAARDSDYSAMRWSPPSDLLDRWMALYQASARLSGGEPNAGQFLAGWAAEAGLDDVRSTSSTWIYDTPEKRQWWGSLWSERIVASKFAEVVEAHGLATHAELEAIAEAWTAFAASPDGRFEVPCGEILCRV